MLRHERIGQSRKWTGKSVSALILMSAAAVVSLSACRGDVFSNETKNGGAAESNLVEGEGKPQPITDPESAFKQVENSKVSESRFRAEQVPSMQMVLAMSWQPGFCEGAPKKSECQSQRPDRYDATHFTLHGLWPQPRSNVYCGVSKVNRSRDKNRNWLDLPAVQTSVNTKQRLDIVMPGTRSNLDRHEWIKHGTCYSRSAETYYRDSLAVMDKINASKVRALFADNIGKTITSNQIRAAFDESFGQGTGKRVRVACKRDGSRLLITELTLGLNGVIGNNPNIGRLASRSRTISPGCPSGIIDSVGLQ